MGKCVYISNQILYCTNVQMFVCISSFLVCCHKVAKKKDKKYVVTSVPF
jgi:hypothetical protein